MKGGLHENQRCLVGLLVLLCLAASVHAHHSTLVSTTSEHMIVQGTITRVEWVNPHVQIYLDAKDSVSGNIVQWRIETESAANLKAKGVSLDNRYGRIL